MARLFMVAALLMATLVWDSAMAQQAPENASEIPLDAVTSQIQTRPGGSVRPPDNAVTNAPAAPGVTRPDDMATPAPALPGQGALDQQGNSSVTSVWGHLRHGGEASVSIPDKNAAVLVQDAGMNWLWWRAKGGPLQVYGGYALLGILVFLGLFYLLRGRIKIESGLAGITMIRFKAIERFAHWVLALSFILLALSGLNLLYGKDWILPLAGKEAFASVTMAGKWLHNNLAWPFMLSLGLVFVLWVWHNIPSRIDLIWLAKGGGLFTKGVHPPSRKFNAGQKLIFWSVILLGISISASGLSLLFPYQLPMFAKTFAILNDLGIGPLVWGAPLPTELTPIQEMQYAQIWHSIIAFAMIFIALAHIYIGSVGMQGAFSAMGTGAVDRNWAREHHGLWVAEEDARKGSATTPGE